MGLIPLSYAVGRLAGNLLCKNLPRHLTLYDSD